MKKFLQVDVYWLKVFICDAEYVPQSETLVALDQRIVSRSISMRPMAPRKATTVSEIIHFLKLTEHSCYPVPVLFYIHGGGKLVRSLK